jgi:putative membrane protein
MHGSQKKMFEFRRQHPVAAISRALGLIRGNVVTIIVLLFIGSRSGEASILIWIGGGFAFLLLVGTITWWRFLYRIEDGELHIKQGVFVRKDLFLTKDRVQVIDITSGVIQRLFGLVKVDIQTAGSTSREAAIDAVTVEQAREISRLLSPEKMKTDPSTGDAESDAAERSEPETTVYKLPGKELLIAASTSGSFGIALSILGTLFSQLEPLVSESQIFEYIINWLPAQTDAMTFIYIIVIFIIFARLISFFSTLFTYGDFSLEVRENEIVISRGIFEKKRITVPYNRIQAIHVSEGLIRQPLGYASVHLESAGYGDDHGTGSIVLFPLIRRGNINQIFENVLPGVVTMIDGVKPPLRALRRYIFRSAFLISAITAGLYWFLNLNEWVWFLPFLSLYWGWQKYRDAAAGYNDGQFIFRSRALSKTTASIKSNRVQDISLTQSFFQRRKDLCTVQISVASGDQGKTFVVRDLELKDGDTLIRGVQKKENRETEFSEGIENHRGLILPGWVQAAY